MNAASEPDVTGFWDWFEGEADRLAGVVQGEQQGEITDIIDDALNRFGLPLTYEVSASEDGPELVFAAEGNEQWAAFLRDMVLSAPSTVWKIHPQRPRRPLDETLAIVQAVYNVDLRQVRFQARVVQGRFHLRFLDDELFACTEDERYDVAALFLDYALGESLATAAIAGLDFLPSGEGIAMGLMVNELIRKAELDLPGD